MFTFILAGFYVSISFGGYILYIYTHIYIYIHTRFFPVLVGESCLLLIDR